MLLACSSLAKKQESQPVQVWHCLQGPVQTMTCQQCTSCRLDHVRSSTSRLKLPNVCTQALHLVAQKTTLYVDMQRPARMCAATTVKPQLACHLDMAAAVVYNCLKPLQKCGCAAISVCSALWSPSRILDSCILQLQSDGLSFFMVQEECAQNGYLSSQVELLETLTQLHLTIQVPILSWLYSCAKELCLQQLHSSCVTASEHR